MPKFLIAGNWKMNLNLRQARDLLARLAEGLRALGDFADRADVAVCPPAIYLFPTAKAIEGTPVQMGAQNAYFEASGAFTGELSVAMIKETGARYVILGHSERRHTIGRGEDDWMINRKVLATIAGGLTPILCIGETMAQRQAGQTWEVLSFQLAADLSSVKLAQPENLIIAYEPVWAIGTGQNATPQQAQEAHAHIRSELSRLFASQAAEIRILYGGSVKADNAEAIMAQPDVNGALVGGASLSADSFLGILRGALAVRR